MVTIYNYVDIRLMMIGPRYNVLYIMIKIKGRCLGGQFLTIHQIEKYFVIINKYLRAGLDSLNQIKILKKDPVRTAGLLPTNDQQNLLTTLHKPVSDL